MMAERSFFPTEDGKSIVYIIKTTRHGFAVAWIHTPLQAISSAARHRMTASDSLTEVGRDTHNRIAADLETALSECAMIRCEKIGTE